MRIYRLEADPDEFQTLVPLVRDEFDVFCSFDGTPQGKRWTPVRVEVFRTDAILDEGLQCDFPHLKANAPVFSLRAVETLRDLLEANGEILPLLCNEGHYFVYNVTSIRDALDEDRSDVFRFSDGRVLDVSKYEFMPERLDGAIVFKLRQVADLSVFVTDAFVEQVQKHGLVGFRFIPVWDEETGPIVRGAEVPPTPEKRTPRKRPQRPERPRPDFTAMFSGVEPDEELLQIIDESGLPQAEQLKALLLPSVRFYATRMADSEIAVGRSKLGGAPDLGPGLSWPTMEGEPLAFLAQVNLAEVSELGLDSPLPRYGMLYFFHAEPRKSIWGTSPEEKDGFRVLFHSGFTDELVRSEIPAELPRRARYRPCLLEGEIEWTIPPWESEQVDALGLSPDESDLYDELETRIWHSRNNYDHRLFGYPDQIQGSVAAACEVGSTDADFSSPDLAEDALHWTLLMQINTEESAGMVWGDGGCLYFCIRDEDLLSLTFENAWMVMQCG